MHFVKLIIIVFTLIVVGQIEIYWGKTDSNHRLSQLEARVQRYPESAQAHYELGVAYLESDDLENDLKAIGVLKQAVQIKPDFAEAYFKLGLAYKRFYSSRLHPVQSIEEIEAYKKAIEINPYYAEAYVALGHTYKPSKPGLNDQVAIKRMMELYNRAIEIKPDYKEAYRGIEGVYLFQSKDKEAIATGKQVILLDPKDDYSYEDFTRYCTILHRCDEVIEAYKEIISVRPDDGKAYAGLGRAYMYKYQYDKAMDALKQAVKFSPEDQSAHYYLGFTYLHFNNKEGATQEYDILRALPKVYPVSDTPTKTLDEKLLSAIND